MSAAFSYLQARLAARHAARPDETTWRGLAAVQGYATFLKNARRTPLNPFLNNVGERASAHEIERLLRENFRRHVAEVAGWVPAPWRPAVAWMGVLPDLPALQRAMDDTPWPKGLQNDARLAALLADNPTPEAFPTPDQLLPAVRAGVPPMAAWLAGLNALAPRKSALSPLLSILTPLLAERAQARDPRSVQQANAAIRQRLRLEFRRQAMGPAAPFIHLGLLLMDLEQLRGALAARLLFPQGGSS